jgi:phosphatidylinositol alpha-1,6-mannosyltransferase
VTGEVVECETPDNLARVVVALLNDPERRARMGTAGRRWVEERFSWDVLSRQAEELFAR